MTRLFTFKSDELEPLGRSKIKKLESCIIYYIYQGRNAWHSTWVTQYWSGCMHTTLESAKENAERLRTQGSVFHIQELPALAFRSAKGVLVVTQINTLQPLRYYSADAVSSLPEGFKRIKGGRENYLSKGAPLMGVAMSFLHSSRFWREAPPAENSVITVSSSDSNLTLKKLTKAKLCTFKSSSFGGGYLLSWCQDLSRQVNISSLYVQRLSNGFIDQVLDR
ncbi:hypothetical protein [Roseibium aquae]|uniref:hypothetical protein n=1 Tax=Roseibium aquae TaxID=1323746 RepID=UPI00123CAD67|nr:hypothetical protein [Roseibium aquae]